MESKLNRVAKLAAVLCMAAVLFALPVAAFAQGGGFDDGGGETGEPIRFDPTDAACVQPYAPYFTHRVPVIFQDLRSETPQIIGWGYAEACTASNKRQGDTYANMLERPNLFPDRFDTLLSKIIEQRDVVEVAEALPDIEDPGDNAFQYPIPPLRRLSIKEITGQEFDVDGHCAGIFCPGIPPELGLHLGAGGFESVNAPDGKRWLIDGGREKGIAVAYFKANRFDSFYVREPRFTPGPSLGYGGVIRAMLNPVDYILYGAEMDEPLAEETEMNDDGTATIPVHVYNGSATERSVTLGWRVQGESEWQLINGPDNKLALDLWAGRPVDVTVSGVEPGTAIEIMVNYDRSQVEMGPGGLEDDAYANNVQRTTLVATVPVDLDLSIAVSAPREYRVDFYDDDPRYPVSMTVRNTGSEPVTARVILNVDGFREYDQNVQLPANGQRSISTSVQAGEWDRTEQLEAVVDPDELLPDRNRTNNRATAGVRILPPPEDLGPVSDPDVDVELSG